MKFMRLNITFIQIPPLLVLMKFTLKQAYHNYLKILRAGRFDVEKPNISKLLDIVSKEFIEVKIKDLDEANSDCDMLLFEYGNYDWDGKGTMFNITFKRQVFFNNIDECGFYGFVLYFSHDSIGEVDSFSKWYSKGSELDSWINAVHETKGFQKILLQPAIKIEFLFQKPH